jgi:hypothetical protein
MLPARTIIRISGTFWLTVGIGLSRVLPIFIGMAFARQYESATYASFVAFVIAVNLVAAIPLMGTSQLILSELGPANVPRLLKEHLRAHLAVHAFCLGAVAFLALALPSPLENNWMNTSGVVLLYLYSLGYCLTGITAASFNKIGERGYAGLCWMVSTTISSFLAFASLWLHLSASCVLTLMVTGWLVGGLFCIYVGLQQPTDNSSFPSISLNRRVPNYRQIIEYGSSSVVYLIGFYLLTQNARLSPETTLQGAFALGYQLFAAALFIPGVLGNVVTPHLVGLKQKPRLRQTFIWKMLGAYTSVAITWLCLTYLILPFILTAFHLPLNPEVKKLVLILQGCASIAAILALLNQLMVAERLSKHILGTAFVWLFFSNLNFFPGQDSAFCSASSMMVAYIASLAYSFLAWYCNQRSISNNEKN